MLNIVATQVRRAARLTVLRHPNSMPCSVMRKRTLRAAPTKIGGRPTLGGAMQLSSEDEDDFEWTSLGEAVILFTGPFEGSAVVRRNDALAQQAMSTALIEMVVAPDDPKIPGIELIPNDIIYAVPGQNVALPYEVLDVIGDINIAPYTRRYVLGARDDLDYLTREVDPQP